MSTKRLVGRDAEITKLVAGVKKSQYLFLHGIDGIGKTAVVEQVMKRLPKNTVPVYLSFSDLNVFTGDEFLLRFGKSVLKAYEGRMGLGDIDDLFEMSIVDLDIHLKSCELFNSVKEKLKVVLTTHKQKIRAYNSALTALINLIDLLASEFGVKCLLVLEDLHLMSGMKEGLDSVGIRKVMELFPSFSHTTYLFTADRKMEILDGFEYVELGVLDKGGWHQGVPLYITLGRESLPAIELMFAERLNRLSSKERIILFAMAGDRVNTPADISRVIDYSQTSIRRFLTIMEEKGFVELKARGLFEVRDPLFEIWLKKRCKR